MLATIVLSEPFRQGGYRLMEVSENRFELWFSKGRFSRLIWFWFAHGMAAVRFLGRGADRKGRTRKTGGFLRNLPAVVRLCRSSQHPADRRTAGIAPADFSGISVALSSRWSARCAPDTQFPDIRTRPLGRRDCLRLCSQQTFWFMTDEYGFPTVARLGQHYSLRKPANVFRVIMLGGSTVEGVGVKSPLESLPSKLQLLLEQELSQTSKQVEVINGGISHFASDQEYLLLIADLLRFEPDLVIAYDGWNDSQHMPDAIAGAPRTRPFRSASQEDNEDRVNASFSPIGAFRLFAAISAGPYARFDESLCDLSAVEPFHAYNHRAPSWEG